MVLAIELRILKLKLQRKQRKMINKFLTLGGEFILPKAGEKFLHLTICADVYSNATSYSAKTFLLKLVAEAPFKIISIQVDGGSEFMVDFELPCKDLGIELYVLPPKKPKYNGGVERGNRIFREEVYAKTDLLSDSIGAMKFSLKQAIHKYNSFRPHKAIDYLTPFQYLNNLSEGASQSNIVS
jgi:transposase InsO family protein